MRKGVSYLMVSFWGVMILSMSFLVNPVAAYDVGGCDPNSLSGGALKKYNTYIANSGNRGGIEAVRWAACKKASGSESNICALWLGPSDDSYTQSVEIDLSQLDENGVYGNLALWGMCTDYSAGADHIELRGDDKDYYTISSTSMQRGAWGEPGNAGVSVNLQVDKNKATGVGGIMSKIGYDLDKNAFVYNSELRVYRCYEGGGGCNDDSTTTLKLKIPQQYYSSSYIGLSGGISGQKVENTGVNPLGNYVEAWVGGDKKPYEAFVGETINITFGHDVYAKEQQIYPAKYYIKRGVYADARMDECAFSDGSDGSYNIVVNNQVSLGLYSKDSCNGAISEFSRSTSINNGPFLINVHGLWHSLYNATDRWYGQDNNPSFFVDDFGVKFNKPGVYKFCETIGVLSRDPNTGACTTINVKEPNPGYYGQSSVAIRDGINDGDNDYSTTGIKSSGYTDFKEDNIPVNNQRRIVFSHDIYSKNIVSDTGWELVRYIDESSKDYKIIESNTCGNNGLAGFYSPKIAGGYYEGTPKNCSNHIAHDEYVIEFTTKSGKIRMCQTIKVNGNEKTQACAEASAAGEPIGGGNKYYAKSNVAIRPKLSNSGGKWDSTGITDNGARKVSDENVSKSAYVYFSHNVYSRDEKDGVSWERKYEVKNKLGAIVTKYNTCGSGDKANFKLKDSGYYVGIPSGKDKRECSDGSWEYIARDIYKVQFTSNKGHVEICQKIYVNGEYKTEVCAYVASGGVVVNNPCDELGATPKDYSRSSSNEAWTLVKTGIQNSTLSEGWKENETYAKPGDTIDWIYCYYPGVQRASNTLATINHKKERAGSPDDSYSLFERPLSDWFFGTWQNQFSLSANREFSPRFNNIVRRRPNGDDTILYYITTDGRSNANEGNGSSTSYVVEYGNSNNKAGKTLTGTITSGEPVYVKTENEGTHHWDCHYESNPVCGQYCAGWDENGECVSWRDRSCYVDTCSHTEDYISNLRTRGPVSASASVKVPYNFKNSATIELASGVVYAGEKVKISEFNVYVNPKPNSITDPGKDGYVTQVDGAQLKLISYVVSDPDSGEKTGKSSGDCGALGGYERCDVIDSVDSEENLTMNSGGFSRSSVKEDYRYSYFGKDYHVYDSDAGKYYCVRAAVYPYTSGGEKNLDPSGDNKWYISSPSCAVIAKKPSFQVWGGSVYAEGAITTNISEKNNLKGSVWGYPYRSTGNGNEIAFASWTEQSAVLGGLTGSFVSGAASSTEFNGDIKNGQSKGTAGADYCKDMVPLSFANYGSGLCGSGKKQTGNSGISVGTSKIAIVHYWWPTEGFGGNTPLNNEEKGIAFLPSNYVEATNSDGKKMRYTYRNGNLIVTAANTTLGTTGEGKNRKGITHVVHATGNIQIRNNLRYDASGGDLETADMIPKYIIYANGNINIECNVVRVDAILIADGYINTCVNSDGSTPDENDSARSKQLKINGIVLASKVLFNRTYGAATGMNSGVPAEIVNYDTSTILWGSEMVEQNDFETINTVYQQELAPRY